MPSTQELLLRIMGDSTSAQDATLKLRKAQLQLEDSTQKASKAADKYGAQSIQHRKALLKVEEAQRKVNNAQTKSSSTLSSLMGKIGSIKTGYLAVAGALGGTARVAWESITAFAESEKVQIKLERAVNNAVGSYDVWDSKIQGVIKSQSRLAAVDDEEVATSLATLVQMTGSVNEALSLNQLALDLSRAKGKDLASTATVLGKVYNGNVGALKRYGVVVEEGATATEALGELQKKYAGYAEDYGNTTAGATDKMAIAFENLKESAGQFFAQNLGGTEAINMAAGGLQMLTDIGWKAVPMLLTLGKTAGWRGLIPLFKGNSEAAEDAASSIGTWADSAYNAAAASDRYKAAVEGLNGALIAEEDAELASLRAKDRVKDAEKTLTKEIRDHGEKSRAARIAQLELNRARREAKDAADKYKTAVEEAKTAENRAAKESAIQEWLKTLRDRWRDVYHEAAGYQRIVTSINMQTRNRNTAGPQRFALGGIVSSPTYAMIGEAGYDEAVIPITNTLRSRALLAQTARAMGYSVSSNNSIGPVTVNMSVNGTITQAKVEAAVDAALTKVVRRAGQLA